MTFTIQAVLDAFVFFLPAYVANTAAAFFGGGRALDGGRLMPDGRRILGKSKTLNGSLGGIFAGTIYQIGGNLLLSTPISEHLILAFFLASGAIAGDLVGSFIKRRLGIESGESAPLLDQLDFAIGALFLASFIMPLEMETVVILLLITPIGHLSVNIMGYMLHKKEVPW